MNNEIYISCDSVFFNLNFEFVALEPISAPQAANLIEYEIASEAGRNVSPLHSLVDNRQAKNPGKGLIVIDFVHEVQSICCSIISISFQLLRVKKRAPQKCSICRIASGYSFEITFTVNIFASNFSISSFIFVLLRRLFYCFLILYVWHSFCSCFALEL